eukprot:TRINITY_DN29896_c0_g1_i1.p1 TRINITY_DN29896_c0_g1~~TRINITY_DN29896_c0_g1_i1.p1  ORF type:complete len:303 (-),score=66.92 TRINITY_DN29896_c0_g1_i1:481-1389(-)
MPAKKAKGGYGGSGVPPASEAEQKKVAELSKKLSPLAGSNLVSIAIPAGGDLTPALDWLASEQSIASAMKSPETKRALTEALLAAKEKLKAHTSLPATGLIVFCGEAQETSSKAKVQKLAMDVVPFKPLRTSLTFVGTSFELSALRELSQDTGQANPQEEALLATFLDEVSRGTGKTAYGSRDTLQALDAAAVTKLIVWQGLDLRRLQVRGKQSGELKFINVSPADERSGRALKPEGEEELTCVESCSFVDWIRDNSWVFGVELELVTGSGDTGQKFREGYGGIGANLRYRMDFDPPEGFDE